MRCFACGRPVALAAGERVAFRDACEGCGADLHVCRNCRHHDPAARNECREPASDPVRDREAANRCDWFQPAAAAAAGEGPPAPDAGDEQARARAALDALFRKD